MSKKILYVLLVALGAFNISARAQALEQFMLHDNGQPTTTILTGINNNNFLTGYIEFNGDTVGFIVSAKGKLIFIDNAALGVTHTMVQGITDKNTALIVGRDNGVTTIYRGYWNAAKDSIHHITQCTNVQQPTATPTDINNKHDISGGYTGITDFMFIKHDSIVPTGNQPWVAKRYDIGGNFSTSCGGINDANKVVGYYIDGSTNSSFVWDNINHTFNVLNATGWRRPWDINNNDLVVGEFKQNNGVYMAFYGTAVNGGYSGFTSLASIFASNTIQSVAYGVNDKKDIVGAFLNPQNNKWCGFICHPDIQEFRLPGYSFTQHSWSILNNFTGNNHAWPATYTQGIDYSTNDPYANTNLPLLDNSIHTTYPNVTTLEPDRDPTWKSFAMEFDKTQAGVSTNTNKKNYYRTILRPKIFDKWYPFSTVGFSGHCAGFAFTSLLRCYYDNFFSSWYGMPANSNLYTIQNTDNTALFAIERGLAKNFDKDRIKYYREPEFLWLGYYRLKASYLQSFADADPFTLTIKTSTSAKNTHNILPYKIRTPKQLPFTAPDTIFVYDSNEPTDSTRYIAMGALYVYANNPMMYSNTYGNMPYMSFRELGIRGYQTKQFSTLKSTSSVTYDDGMTVGMYGAANHNIKWNGSTIAESWSGNYQYDSVSIAPIFRPDTGITPTQYYVDTNKTINIVTNDYQNNAMVITQINAGRSMGLSRNAVPTETDHITQKNAMIAYGNPDNNTKMLNAFLRESEDTEQQGVNIMASNICADHGDSIVISSSTPYTLNIIKMNGANSCTYNIDIYAAYNGEIQEFHSGAMIDPNSSHTIDPYFNNGNGDQIAVIVDNGQDGIPDDTLFVTGFPLDMKAPLHNIKINVYPNPVSEILSLEFNSVHDAYTVNLTDVVGRNVYNGSIGSQNNKLEIPMGSYPTGIYMLRVTDTKGNLMYVDKIVKQ